MGSPRGCEGEDMTVKRDFKRRVRQRQVRTGESYVTARRHVLASRPGADPDHEEPDPALLAAADDAGGGRAPGGGDAGDRGGGDGGGDDEGRPAGGISVVELVDVTEQARQAGLLCRTLMFPSLVERIAPPRVLARLREVLLATAEDPATARLSRLALTGQVPPRRRRDDVVKIEGLRRLLQRARAGVSGTLDDGATLAFHVADGGELVAILCTLSLRDTWIELSIIGGPLPEAWAPLASVLTRMDANAGEAVRRRELAEALTGEVAERLWQLAPRLLPEPRLFVVCAGRRHAVSREPFVIGHNAEVCDLVLDDRAVSAEHAAVIVRGGGYYLKDLGSTDGIVYKGMQIDNKRIFEGDVFEIAGHELRFTYLDG